MWRVLACVAPGPFGEHGQALVIPKPAIERFTVDCEVETGDWRLDVTASSWTGGGVSLWSEDLRYIERHVVGVVESEPEAAGETLELTLTIVSDWRAQAPNNSTVFTCADDPNIAFTLYDVDGVEVDCRVVGPDAEALYELPEAELCRE